MSPGEAILIFTVGAIGALCTILLLARAAARLVLYWAVDAEETVQARCERLDREQRLVEAEECEALARGLGLLPDPLESMYAAPAYDKERVR